MRNNNGLKLRNIVILHIIAMMITLTLSIVIITDIVKTVDYYKVYSNANFTKVYATIVRYEDKSRYNATFFTTYYEFKTEKGTYSGYWQRNINSEEEANWHESSNIY